MLGDSVTAISVVTPGSGYTSVPAVNIVGGGATTNATAVATVDQTPGSPTYGTVTPNYRNEWWQRLHVGPQRYYRRFTSWAKRHCNGAGGTLPGP